MENAFYKNNTKNILISIIFILLFLLQGGKSWAQDSYRWTGDTSSDWNTPTNWQDGIVPPGDTNVEIIIGAGAKNNPKITTTITIKVTKFSIEAGAASVEAASLTIESGGSLTIKVAADGEISNNGTITNNGNFTGTFISENSNFINNGTIKNNEFLSVPKIENNGSITNTKTINVTDFKNQKEFTNENGGTLTVTNKLENLNGKIINNEGATIDSQNIINETDQTETRDPGIINSGTIKSKDITNKTGIIQNNDGATIDSDKITNNAGDNTIKNEGSIETDSSIPGVDGNQPKPSNPSNELTTNESFDGTTNKKLYSKITLIENKDQVFKQNPDYQYPEIIINKTGGSVTFENYLDVKKLTISNDNKCDIIFKAGGTIEDTATIKTTGSVKLAGIIKTNGILTIENPVELIGNTSIENISTTINNQEVIFKNTITGNYELNIKNLETVTFKGNIGTDDKKLKSVDFSTSNNINLPSEIHTSGSIILAGAGTPGTYPTLNLNSSGTTLSGGDITLSDNIATNAPLIINNSGILTFLDSTDINDKNNGAKISSFEQKGTGNVNLAGDILNDSPCAAKVSFNSPVTLTGNTALKAKEIIFNDTLSGDFELFAHYDPLPIETITFNNNIKIKSLVLNATNSINLPENVETTGTDDSSYQEYYGPVKIKNTSFTAKKTITFRNTVKGTSLTATSPVINLSNTDITTEGSQTYNGDTKIDTYLNPGTPLSIKITKKITNKDEIVSFKKNLTLNKKSLKISAHTKFSGSNISGIESSISAENCDFVIQPSDTSDVTIDADITANRILIDNSLKNITINKSLKAKDIAIFGSSYCTTDQESKIENIYTYDFTSPACTKPKSKQFSAYSSKEFRLSNATLTADSIFYINGTKITGTGTFTLPANYNTTEKKAEAFYTAFDSANITISNKDSSKLVTENCKLKTSHNFENGWDSIDFEIKKACIIDDNVIRIDFTRPIRIKTGEINGNVNGLSYNLGKSIYNSNGSYDENIFTSTDNEKTFKLIQEGNDSTTIIYLTSSSTWNTDATGTSAGYGTDKKGVKSSIIPYIQLNRNTKKGYSYFITDLYGKRLKHYAESGTGKNYTKNHKIKTDDGKSEYIPDYDQCAPVIVSVSTGQELHDKSSPKPYDAHNFIEFRYSEPVYIGSDSNSYLNKNINSSNKSEFNTSPENISPTPDMGEIKNEGSGFTVTGIGKISSGHISTATQKNPEKEDLSINTLYRKDTLSIRISIAGKTTKKSSYKNTWDGFINESTKQPSGSITVFTLADSVVQDFSKNFLNKYNCTQTGTSLSQNEIKYTLNTAIPDYGSDNKGNIPAGRHTDDFTYGPWDLSAPTLAPMNYSSTIWEPQHKGEYEIIGTGKSYIDDLELHMLDNTPTFTNEEKLIWYSSNGWFDNGTLIGVCADIYGGSRPFVEKNKGRTVGGIRQHTLDKVLPAFNVTANKTQQLKFEKITTKGIYSSFFTGYSHTQFAFPDKLYFKLNLKPDQRIAGDSFFQLSYTPTPSTGYITDLAGNKLKKIEEKGSTEKAPPAFNVISSPINKNELFLIFSKQIERNLSELQFYEDSTTPIDVGPYSFEELLTRSLRIVNIKQDGSVDTTAEVPVIKKISCSDVQKKDGTKISVLRLTLNRNITFEDLQSLYIQIGPTKKADGTYIEKSVDRTSGIENSRVTIIRDDIGNYMKMYTAHSISNFGINVINPLYAYTPNIKNGDESYLYGLYKDGSWAVHDWAENQHNYGTVLANEEVHIVIDSNLPEGVSIDKIELYISKNPDPESVSTQINTDLNENYRIWLPLIPEQAYAMPSISHEHNTNFKVLNATEETISSSASTTPLSNKIYFKIDENLAKEFGTNSQMSFLFRIKDATICLNPTLNTVDDTTNMPNYTMEDKAPLFCLRLSDQNNSATMDMWSYRTKTTTFQRGGVTILNNVINNSDGEDTMLKVSVPEDGNLNIMIMTVDGNIVKYIHKGHIKAGDYDYYWNGTNSKNVKVARGLYFIRVAGAGLDETRKVMVVK